MQAATTSPIARFHHFLAQITRLVELSPAEPALLAQGRQYLSDLISQDDWLPPEFAQAHPLHYQQYLLYADPQNRFSVVSFVGAPGSSTSIHDHTVWGLFGMLRGSEFCQPYSRMSDGRWAPAGFQISMLPGDVEAVSPRIGDVHKVWNALADQVCISIHVYGANIGLLETNIYREDGMRSKTMFGYANAPTSTEPVTSLATSAAEAPATPADTTSPANAQVPETVTPPSESHAALPAADTSHPYDVTSYAQVRAALLAKDEIALVDVREEALFAQSHPLFAINLPYGRLEIDAHKRIPRRDTPVVVYDNGEGMALQAMPVLQRLGYTQLSVLQNGLAGWAAAGGELFRDVHVPSKSFGELVEIQRKTPSFSAHEVKALLDRHSDMVVLDARRFEEYQAMSVPGAINVPGGELVLRARSLAPNPTTRIVVNCEERTRSILGAQSLINSGIPNPVCALRNGMLGWRLAGFDAIKGASQCFGDVNDNDRGKAAASALALLFRAGVPRVDQATVKQWLSETDRNTYVFDVRSPEEFAQGHWAGASSAPGGQLLEETDRYIGVRGARVVLYDDDGVRASTTASWLAQMGWQVAVMKDLTSQDLQSKATWSEEELPPTLAPLTVVDPPTLKTWLANRSNLSMVIDVGDSATYVKRHIPGAWWLLRSQMAQDFTRVHKANRYILTCGDGRISRYAVAELKPLLRPGVEVLWLPGGNAAWQAAGFSTQQGESYLASPRIDRYRLPHEDMINSVQTLQAYLDWKLGLVEQLKRDGTHHFKVL